MCADLLTKILFLCLQVLNLILPFIFHEFLLMAHLLYGGQMHWVKYIFVTGHIEFSRLQNNYNCPDTAVSYAV
jgi:hypothetical protein